MYQGPFTKSSNTRNKIYKILQANSLMGVRNIDEIIEFKIIIYTIIKNNQLQCCIEHPQLIYIFQYKLQRNQANII